MPPLPPPNRPPRRPELLPPPPRPLKPRRFPLDVPPVLVPRRFPIHSVRTVVRWWKILRRRMWHKPARAKTAVTAVGA